jgi:hypothetical protein
MIKFYIFRRVYSHFLSIHSPGGGGLDDFKDFTYYIDILETTSFSRFLEEKRVERRSTLFLSKNWKDRTLKT